MTLTLPDAAIRAFGENAEAKLRLLAAIKAYEIHQLTAGAAAELAGMSKLAFLQKLGEYGVPVFEMTAEDLERDHEAARRVASRR